MSYEEITKMLEESGVSYRIHEHDPVITMQDVEDTLPFPSKDLLKTLVFKIRDSYWILAVVRGNEKIDYRNLAESLGVKRGELVKPSAEEVENQLGSQIGGICPIPLSDNTKAIFDKSLIEMNKVYCGIGRNDRSLEINIYDLIKVSQARLYPITRNHEIEI